MERITKESDLPKKKWGSPMIQQKYLQIKLPQRSSALYFVEFRLGARANLVPRVSLLCLPWSLEERPWLRLVMWPPRIWVAKRSVGSEGWQSILCVDVTNFVGNKSDHLAVVLKNYSFYRGAKSNLPMKDATRFLPFLKYRRLSFTKKFGSRMEQKLFDV